MNLLSKSIFSAFLGTVLLASCSRPVAYFQPTAREQFATTQTKAAAPVATETVAVTKETAPVAAPAEQVAQAQKAVDQLEAYVSSDSKLASNKKVAKHMARLNEMMATASAKATVANTDASAKKMSFMQRTMLKKLNNKIKAKAAPEEAKASSNTRLGLIIGVIGIILILVGAIASVGALTVIGLIGLIVGLVLLLLGLANA